jgi:hypothetical protein
MLSPFNRNRCVVAVKLAKLLLLIVSISLFGVFVAQGIESKFQIRGIIRSSDGRPSIGATVELKRIVMSSNPTIDTIDKTESDSMGRYRFKIAKIEQKVFFRIDVTAGSTIVGSDPIKFKSAQNEIVADFTLPEISKRTEGLIVEKNIFVFDLLESGIQVTEIINLVNQSAGTVDTRQGNYEKTIPEEATDFYYLKKNKEFNVAFESGRVIFRLMVPEGQHQLYYSYNLPAAGNSIVFGSTLLPNTSDVELIAPSNGPEISFLFGDNNREKEIVRKDQFYSNRLYHSQVLPTVGDLDQVRVQIKGIPFSTTGFMYPAIVLAFLLMAGLFWFLIVRYRSQANI